MASVVAAGHLGVDEALDFVETFLRVEAAQAQPPVHDAPDGRPDFFVQSPQAAARRHTLPGGDSCSNTHGSARQARAGGGRHATITSAPGMTTAGSDDAGGRMEDLDDVQRRAVLNSVASGALTVDEAMGLLDAYLRVERGEMPTTDPSSPPSPSSLSHGSSPPHVSPPPRTSSEPHAPSTPEALLAIRNNAAAAPPPSTAIIVVDAEAAACATAAPERAAVWEEGQGGRAGGGDELLMEDLMILDEVQRISIMASVARGDSTVSEAMALVRQLLAVTRRQWYEQRLDEEMQAAATTQPPCDVTPPPAMATPPLDPVIPAPPLPTESRGVRPRGDPDIFDVSAVVSRATSPEAIYAVPDRARHPSITLADETPRLPLRQYSFTGGSVSPNDTVPAVPCAGMAAPRQRRSSAPAAPGARPTKASAASASFGNPFAAAPCVLPVAETAAAAAQGGFPFLPPANAAAAILLSPLQPRPADRDAGNSNPFAATAPRRLPANNPFAALDCSSATDTWNAGEVTAAVGGQSSSFSNNPFMSPCM